MSGVGGDKGNRREKWIQCEIKERNCREEWVEQEEIKGYREELEKLK